MLAVLVGLARAAPAAAASKYDWNAIGIEFCKATLTGDITAVAPLLTDSLLRDIDFAMAAGSAEMPPARVLFQTYTTEVPVCEVQDPQRRAGRDPAQRSGAGEPHLVGVSGHRPGDGRGEPDRRRALRHAQERHAAGAARRLCPLIA